MTDDGVGSPLFATTVREEVVEIAREGTTWLSTGWRGGRTTAAALHSVHVPEGWDCESIDDYVDSRLSRAGFDRDGPVLLTGVDAAHVRGARCGPVEAYATAGVSNPAALPIDPDGPPRAPNPTPDCEAAGEGSAGYPTAGDDPGTVNVVVGTDRALAPGALANLVAVASETKAAILLDTVGVPGTTTDAVVTACDPDGEPAQYSGSATAVGAAARACVREAIRASLDARYPDGDWPDPERADHAAPTEARATTFDPRSDATIHGP